MPADEIINAYERLRAAVLGAEPIPRSELATMRHEGLAAWAKATHGTPVLRPFAPAVRQPPVSADTTRNELALLLASLVVTLSMEVTGA